MVWPPSAVSARQIESARPGGACLHRSNSRRVPLRESIGNRRHSNLEEEKGTVPIVERSQVRGSECSMRPTYD